MQALSLDQVEKAFQDWRQGRTHKRESIPQRLWDMVLQLTPHYQRSLICRRLKLSGYQFKRKGVCLDQQRLKIPGGFVVAQAPTTAQFLPSSLTLTIQGKSRKLMINVPSAELSQVLPHLATLL